MRTSLGRLSPRNHTALEAEPGLHLTGSGGWRDQACGESQHACRLSETIAHHWLMRLCRSRQRFLPYAQHDYFDDSRPDKKQTADKCYWSRAYERCSSDQAEP